MGKSRKILTHAEVWDDTALLQSWEDALQEYKLYHSIHAKGERVEDVIKDMDETLDSGTLAGPQDPSSARTDTNEAVAGMDEDLEEGEFDEDSIDAGDLLNGTHEDVFAATLEHKDSSTSKISQPQAHSTSVPTTASNEVNDDATKNLMLSWYWAGYYTGLHEGQQQAAQAQNGKS